MPIISSIIIGAISAIGFNFALDYQKKYNDAIYRHVDLTPLNRATLQNFTDLHRNSLVEAHIVKTVEDIYVAVKREASIQKHGYHHNFVPLLPVDSFPPYIYVSEVLKRLKDLFPGCDVEMNHRLGVYGVYWYDEAKYN